LIFPRGVNDRSDVRSGAPGLPAATLPIGPARSLRAPLGITLVDVLLTAVILSILAVISLPALRFDDPVRLISASTMITADLEYAQSATLASPANPVIVKFDSDGAGYWLALKSAPDTPIPRPGSGDPFEVEFGSGAFPYFQGLKAVLDSGGKDGAVEFDAFGRLQPSLDVRILVINGSGDVAVNVKASTGSVSVSED